MNAVVHTSSKIERERLIRMVLQALEPARGVVWLMQVNNLHYTNSIAQLARRFGVVVVFDAQPHLEPAHRVLCDVLVAFEKNGWHPRQAAVAGVLGWSLETVACVSAELQALRVVKLDPPLEA